MKYEEALKMFYEDAKIGIHSLVEKEAIEYQYNKLKEVIAKAEKYDELTSLTVRSAGMTTLDYSATC